MKKRIKINYGNEQVVETPEKSVDELFESQFKNMNTSDTSGAPDIPISLKDINKAVNSEAATDEGQVQEETLENIVVEDGEGAYDLDELEEEIEEDIEEEVDEEAEKKAKKKALRDKRRKEEAKRRAREEEEQRRYQETASTRRNKEYAEEDYLAHKEEEARTQREKIDNLLQKEEPQKDSPEIRTRVEDFTEKDNYNSSPSFNKEEPSYRPQEDEPSSRDSVRQEDKEPQRTESYKDSSSQREETGYKEAPRTSTSSINDDYSHREQRESSDRYREEQKAPVSETYRQDRREDINKEATPEQRAGNYSQPEQERRESYDSHREETASKNYTSQPRDTSSDYRPSSTEERNRQYAEDDYARRAQKEDLNRSQKMEEMRQAARDREQAARDFERKAYGIHSSDDSKTNHYNSSRTDYSSENPQRSQNDSSRERPSSYSSREESRPSTREETRRPARDDSQYRRDDSVRSSSFNGNRQESSSPIREETRRPIRDESQSRRDESVRSSSFNGGRQDSSSPVREETRRSVRDDSQSRRNDSVRSSSFNESRQDSRRPSDGSSSERKYINPSALRQNAYNVGSGKDLNETPRKSSSLPNRTTVIGTGKDIEDTGRPIRPKASEYVLIGLNGERKTPSNQSIVRTSTSSVLNTSKAPLDSSSNMVQSSTIHQARMATLTKIPVGMATEEGIRRIERVMADTRDYRQSNPEGRPRPFNNDKKNDDRRPSPFDNDKKNNDRKPRPFDNDKKDDDRRRKDRGNDKEDDRRERDRHGDRGGDWGGREREHFKKKYETTSGSLFEAKKHYLKKIGSGALGIGEGAARSLKNQVWNTFKENDAINTGSKTSILILGAASVGALMRVQSHKALNVVNIGKIKANQIGNAWRYFQGPKEVMVRGLNLEKSTNGLLNLKKGSPPMLTRQIDRRVDLRLVPHTAGQFEKELLRYGKLNSLTKNQLNAQIRALKNTLRGAKLPLAEEKELLKTLKGLKTTRRNFAQFKLDTRAARRAKTAMSLLMQSITRSEDLAANTISEGIGAVRHIKQGVRLIRAVEHGSIATAGFAFRVVTKNPVSKFVGEKVSETKFVHTIKSKVEPIKTIKNQVKQGVLNNIHGGLYKKGSQLSAQLLSKHEKLNTVVQKIGKATNKVGKGVSTVKKGVNTVTRFLGKAGRVVTAPVRFVTAPLRFADKVFKTVVNKVLLPVCGFGLILYIGVMIIMTCGSLVTGMIFTETDNLNQYIGVLTNLQTTDFNEIAGYQSQAGHKHGKYNIVTVNYLDENGNQTDSSDNFKEILSMVAVHIENDWPDFFESVVGTFTGDWTAGKVKDLIKELYDASHEITTTDIGPYSCEGCEERDYFCTDALPSDASQERIELHNAYASRGGCTSYQQEIMYYCSDDRAVFPDGSTYYNAHSQSWANNQMTELYAYYTSRGGHIDSIKHSDSYDSPASGCANYTTESYVKESLRGADNWPSVVTFTWDYAEERYEYYYGGTTWSLGKAFEGQSLTYTYNSSSGVYERYGTKYVCREHVYSCDGHRTTITLYRCDGHHEIYCPGDHYDLEVNVVTIHVPELYERDPRSLGVIDSYPESAGEDDFYWDQSNRDWCATLYSEDWNTMYEGIKGLNDPSVAGNPLTEEQIAAYLDDLDDLSADRKAFIETALRAVGRIPYYYGGYATRPGYEGNDFGAGAPPDSQGRVYKGLDCSHFIDWVSWTALGNNLGNTWTGGLWDLSTETTLFNLKPGDIGFQNQGGNPVNHVGIYLGNGLWIHCSSSAGNVVISNSTSFMFFRTLNNVR